jgi:hypothetical protein
MKLLDSFDLADLHGGFLILCEIAYAYREFGDADQLEGRMRDVKIYCRVIYAGDEVYLSDIQSAFSHPHRCDTRAAKCRCHGSSMPLDISNFDLD